MDSMMEVFGSSHKEILIGDGYIGEPEKMCQGVIIPRIEGFSDAQEHIHAQYINYARKHDVNPLLLEVFYEGDPGSLIGEKKRDQHKQFVFEMLCSRHVRGVNLLPRNYVSYSYLVDDSYLELDQLTPIIAAYFGELSTTEELCKRVAMDFNQYMRMHDHSIPLCNDKLPDPYYAEIYEIYHQLMNDAYPVAGMSLQKLKRFSLFIRYQQHVLPTFLSIYLSQEEYEGELQPACVRGTKEYQQCLETIYYFFEHQLLVSYLGIKYNEIEKSLCKEIGYAENQPDAIVKTALREHAIMETFSRLMDALSRGRQKNYDACSKFVSIIKNDFLFGPFILPLEKLMQKDYPFLWKMYREYDR